MATTREREPALFRVLSAVEMTVGCALIVIIFVTVFLQAAQRYLPVDGWVGLGELAQYSLAGLTFIMCGYLMGKGRHITIEVIDQFVSRRIRGWVKALANALVTVICVGFIVEGFALVTESSGQVSPAMRMPMNFLYVLPLIGFTLTALRAVWAIFVPQSQQGGKEVDMEGESA